MKNYSHPVKAYKNLEFLNSADARTIRILSEFYEPQSRFRRHHIVDTIVFFGSARIIPRNEARKRLRELKKNDDGSSRAMKEKIKHAEKILAMSAYYEEAVELSRRLTEWSMNLPTDKKRFIICSGGGPGIMEAANKGAKIAGGPSIGLNISIPFEQFVNTYVSPELAFEFHYFFMRKFWFAYLAKALIIFPGGFGTLDELMEILTLRQTGKSTKKMKIIVYGEDYWRKVLNVDQMIEKGTVSKADLKLFDFSNDVDDAFKKITDFLTKNYLNSKSRF